MRPDELRRLLPQPWSEPRVRPGGVRRIGIRNWLLAAAASLGTGGARNVFFTLARDRRVFRAWLRLGANVMALGTMPRRDTELVILRTAHRCGSAYEWHQHVPLGLKAGLTPAEIQALAVPAPVLADERDAVLVRAVDELTATHDLSSQTWDALAGELDTRELLQFLHLHGYYAGLAGALNAMRVQVER